MNYLAHAFLSFDHEETLVGNLVSDFIKGKNKFNYPEGIQKGITLHRAIDSFTDTHEATKLAKNIFRPHYRLYSGAFVDVAYDHFLATDADEFSEETLRNFSEKVYSILDRHIEYLPLRFARMFPYMKLQNWLYNYHSKWGTESSFAGLVRRAKYIDESETAALLFEEHYKKLHECYKVFFPDLKSFAYKMYRDLTGV
ncbi:MAG: ACP phosphodiesterase [Chitinophagales bacterium]